MATFTSFDDLQGAEFVDANLQGAEFVDANLHGARFRRADLSDVVMRAVHVRGMDIEAPFLFDRESFLRVNGVDVVPLVEAELNRRFPGRADRGATDPDGLRAASDDLAGTRKNPWAPEYPETVLSCLHVILREEWEHHRYAVRDLDAIDAARDS